MKRRVVNLLKYEKNVKCLSDPLPPCKAEEPGLFIIFLWAFEFNVAKFQPLAHWNDISMGTKHWHCQFLTFLWPYDFKILATIAPWNDISKDWHFQYFTFPWPHEFKVAKFRPS